MSQNEHQSAEPCVTVLMADTVAYERVLSLRKLPDGPTYELDSIEYMGRPRRWIVIGSTGCPIRIDSVGDTQYLLRRDHQRLYVVDDRQVGCTMINGIPLADTIEELRPGQLLTVGSTTFLACGEAGESQQVDLNLAEQKRRIAALHDVQERPVSVSEKSARTDTCTVTISLDATSDPVCHLRVMPDGPLHSLDEHLNLAQLDTPITLGSDSHCAIVVEHPSISACHCLFQRENGRWLVRDNASRNGTWLNGVRLDSRYVELLAGSLLRLGKLELLACGRDGAKQLATIAASDLQELARRSMEIYGSERQAARRLRLPRPTLLGWLNRRR